MSLFSSRPYKLIMFFVIILCAAIVPACAPTQAQLNAAATANYPETEEYQATFAAAAVAQTVAAQAAVDLAVAQTVEAQIANSLLLQPGDISQTAVITSTSSIEGSPKSNGGEAVPIAPVAVVPVPVDASIPQLSIPKSINVRSGPGTAYKVVGTLPAGAIVNVIAKNKAGDWFNILMPDGVTKGWVAASVTTAVSEPAMTTVQVAVTIPALPTTPPTATKAATSVATHTPAATSASGHTATPTTTHNATHTPSPTPPPIPIASPTSEYGIYTTLIVTNYGTSDICELYFAPSSDPDWGNNKLSSPMGNTSLVSFDINAGTYDLRAWDCFDNIVKDQRNVNISGVYYWDIN